MQTVLDVLNAIEAARGDYDDEIVFILPIVGNRPNTYEVVDFKNEDGRLLVILSRNPA